MTRLGWLALLCLLADCRCPPPHPHTARDLGADLAVIEDASAPPQDLIACAPGSSCLTADYCWTLGMVCVTRLQCCLPVESACVEKDRYCNILGATCCPGTSCVEGYCKEPGDM